MMRVRALVLGWFCSLFFFSSSMRRKKGVTHSSCYDSKSLKKNKLRTSNTYIDVLLGALVSSNKVWSIRISLKGKKQKKRDTVSLY